MQQCWAGHEADMERTLQRADQRKIQRWLWELDQRGEVRFGISVPKALLLGAVAWVFFLGLVGAAIALVVDPPDLILFRDASRPVVGVLQLLFLVLMLGLGLLLFGAGAVLVTFVFRPPRTIVTRDSVALQWGRRIQVQSRWSDVVRVLGRERYSRIPFHRPWEVSLLTRAFLDGSLPGRSRVKEAGPGEAIPTGSITWMSAQSSRDIFAFLVAVHQRMAVRR
jgi:hypothetical protein